MDSTKIIKHIYIGSKNCHLLAQFFTHISGVIYVYRGIQTLGNESFIHIAFDDLETTFKKLLTLYISIAHGVGDFDLVIFLDGEDKKEIEEIIIDATNKLKDIKLLQKQIGEYSLHEKVLQSYEDLVIYLAYGDEAGLKSSTKEGLSNELSNTKSAMLNLLEDAYEAQDKIIMQTESLSAALSESKKFAQTAEDERSNYLLLLSSVGEGIIVLNNEGSVDIANNAILSLLRMKREDIYGKKLSETLEIRDRNGSLLDEGLIKKVLTTEDVLKLPPYVITRKDGTIFTVSTLVSPVRNKQTNQHIGVILTVRDIGEELALEDARINFISTASHQLRTPLTSMRWFSEMLYNGEAGPTTADQHQYIEQINQGINRMVILVNFLLRTARVESNRTKITPVNLKVSSILELCVDKLGENFKKRNQTIKIIAGDIPEIPLDKDYVTEVFTNILENANIYGKDNDEIIIEEKIEDKLLSISITDHGIGIKEEDASRVFAKFFRSEQAVILSPDGTGLGLSFVELLVKEWGGTITFTSKPDVGTTFTVTIPLTGMTERKGEVGLNE